MSSVPTGTRLPHPPPGPVLSSLCLSAPPLPWLFLPEKARAGQSFPHTTHITVPWPLLPLRTHPPPPSLILHVGCQALLGGTNPYYLPDGLWNRSRAPDLSLWASWCLVTLFVPVLSQLPALFPKGFSTFTSSLKPPILRHVLLPPVGRFK